MGVHISPFLQTEEEPGKAAEHRGTLGVRVPTYTAACPSDGPQPPSS